MCRDFEEYTLWCGAMNERADELLIDGKLLVEFKKNKHAGRIGTVVAFKSQNDGHVHVGWSSYNYKKERVPFNREVGIKLAIEKATDIQCFDLITYNPKEKDKCFFVKRNMRHDFWRMVDRASKYFKIPDAT